jgi:hypothetical protein
MIGVLYCWSDERATWVARLSMAEDILKRVKLRIIDASTNVQDDKDDVR